MYMFEHDRGDTNGNRSPRWPVLWVRTALRTAILQALESEPLHGYGIALALGSEGFGRPKGGSLYPILEELTEGGWLTSAWQEQDRGPGRRVYLLTADGAARLEHERRQWRELSATLGASLASPVNDDATACARSKQENPHTGKALRQVA